MGDRPFITCEGKTRKRFELETNRPETVTMAIALPSFRPFPTLSNLIRIFHMYMYMYM